MIHKYKQENEDCESSSEMNQVKQMDKEFCYMSHKKRSQLEIMVIDFKLPCFQASKMLNLRYGNSKLAIR